MTPAALRLIVTTLPWNDYSEGELNEIRVLAYRILATVKNREQEMCRESLQAEMAKRPASTPEQIAASVKGSPFD